VYGGGHFSEELVMSKVILRIDSKCVLILTRREFATAVKRGKCYLRALNTARGDGKPEPTQEVLKGVTERWLEDTAGD